MKMVNEYVDELVDVLTDEPEDIYETGHRLQAIVKAIRREAVERCASVVDDMNICCDYCAERIIAAIKAVVD